MIKAVIFDMDGTLLDSERIGIKAWQYVIDKYSLPFDLSLPYRSIGLNYDSMKTLFLSELGEDYPFDKYWGYAKQYFAEFEKKNGIPVKPGFDELCTYLKANKVGMYVATSTYHASAANELEHSGILGYFDGIIGGDEITKGKPDPEIFIKSAEKTGFDKSECLIVEDSSNGLRAGIASGIRTVFIKDIVDVPSEITDKVFARCDDLSGVIGIISQIR